MSPQQKAVGEAVGFVDKLNSIILFPLVALLAAVAFLIFLWGCAEYIVYSSNESKRAQGIKHITFGIIGLVVMMSAWAILSIATATFGLSDELDCAKDPTASGCSDKFQIEPNTFDAN